MEAEPDSNPASGSFSSAVNGGVTVEECQNMIQKSIRTPTVKFLKEKLEKAGCSIGDNFVKAVNCNQRMNASGGLSPGDGV